MKSTKKNFFRYIFYFLCFMMVLTLNNCKEPVAKKFNHSSTLFPLHGAHLGVNCRECHKDGSMTSLPIDCQSCHPMTPNHTLNLGDCDLCHTTATFSTPYFNHNRIGIHISGVHVGLFFKDKGCQNCHIPGTYQGITFACGPCHQKRNQPPSFDGIIHKSSSDPCEQCHTQITFKPGKFVQHDSYATKLAGAHSNLECSACHPSTFSNWANINYRDGRAYGSCADCHYRNYKSNHHHHGITADANCGACHGYSSFHGGD